MLALPQALIEWCRDWSAGKPLENCDAQDVERMARDIGVSVPELRSLARCGPHSADLLLCRMAALDLDADEVAATMPMLLQDLQRVCSFCSSHRRCAHDLARDTANPAWHDYCPNAETLMELDAMPWAARSEW